MSPKKQSRSVANARKVTKANSKMRSRKPTKFFINSVHCQGNAIFQPSDDCIDLTNDDSGNNSDCEYVGTTMSNSCFKGAAALLSSSSSSSSSSSAAIISEATAGAAVSAGILLSVSSSPSSSGRYSCYC
jgi:hypothetical protein